jgi:hypothetical protein
MCRSWWTISRWIGSGGWNCVSTPGNPCERDEEAAPTLHGKKAALRMELLTPEGVEIAAGQTAGENRDGKEMSVYAIHFAAARSTWRNAVALSWAPLAAGRRRCRWRKARIGGPSATAEEV